MDDDARKKLDEAHEMASRYDRLWHQLPDGAERDALPRFDRVNRIIVREDRREWLRRVLLVQIPVLLAAVGVLGGAIMGALKWLISKGLL